ncbi:MAG: hypothetical protein JW782_00045 [Candidatus Saganbacteria bacterium]|nr:hypothetical protein [Candidatus Saganbacteria bacterium]
MDKIICYDNYPPLFALAANLVTFAIYALGAVILSGLGPLYAVIFLLYCLALEIRLMKKSCVDCYYYGKLCFSGRGLLCSLFLRRGDPQRFLSKQLAWQQLIPDFLLTLAPLCAGIVLFIMDFSWTRLGLMAALLVLGLPVTGYIRGCLACLHCRQRGLGCPAADLFKQGAGSS